MMTGMSRPQKASFRACQRSRLLDLGMTFRSILRPKTRETTISPPPISRPGTRPEMNRSVMDAPSAMEPNTTKVMEEGITTPMAPPASIRAQEKGAE